MVSEAAAKPPSCLAWAACAACSMLTSGTRRPPATPACSVVVVNRDGALEETVAQIEAILQAEKARVPRRLGSGGGLHVP